MSSFECPGVETCPVRNVCLALEASGVAIGGDESDTPACQVPGMFEEKIISRRRGGVKFEPEMQGGIEKTDLVGELGKAARKIMTQEVSTSRRELLGAHEALLEARIDLWRAMLEAPKQNRQFTREEKAAHEVVIAKREKKIKKTQANGGDAVLAIAGFDSKCLDEHNILFDNQMVEVIDRLVGNMMDGQPTLLRGDKGIAKTAVAKFASRLGYDGEPLVISGHGDMGTNEFIGEVGLKDGKTYFKEGRIPQAAREGRPIILDEVNVADVAVILRLQDILLNLKPGSEMVLQENGQGGITVQPGFAVIATANEASRRYVHRQVSDPANRDRYDVISVDYPDLASLNGSTDVLRRNMANLRRLAYAAVSDHEGNITGVTSDEVEKLVTLASATQLLYSQPATSALREVAGVSETTAGALDDEPIMTDCITPRRLYADLDRLAPGNKPGFNFRSVVESLVERLDEGDQTHNSDIARHLLSEIAKI
jgi:MoxR-like ATPase